MTRNASKSSALLRLGNILVESRDSNISNSILSWMGEASFDTERHEGRRRTNHPNSYWDLIHFSHHPSKVWTPIKIHQIIKSLPLAENLELDGACRCASQWLQRTTWLFDPGCADDTRMKCWCSTPSSLRFLGLLPTERGFHHLSTILVKLQQHGILTKHSVWMFVWWSSRAFRRVQGALTFAPGPWRRGESQGTGGRANPTSGILNLWGDADGHVRSCYLLDGIVSFSILSHRVLISIGRHWHTLPAQVTNYSSQHNCSANIVAYWSHSGLACWNTSIRVNQRCGGAWNQTRSRCWHLQVATAWNSWKCQFGIWGLVRIWSCTLPQTNYVYKLQ